MIRVGSMFTYLLWSRRRGVIGWTIGLVLLAVITVAFFPAISRNAEAFTKMIDAMPKAMLAIFGIEDPASMLSAVGFVNSRLYASIGTALLLIFGIGAGAAAIAGAEEAGELEIVCAQPTPRWRLVLDSAAALAVLLAAPCAALAVTLAIADAVIGLGLSAAGIAAANVGLFLLAWMYAVIALALGSLTGKRGVAVGATAALAGAAFVIQGLAPLVASLRFSRSLSPFHWFLGDTPLGNGFSASFALLPVVAIAAIAVAAWGFERRDLGV